MYSVYASGADIEKTWSTHDRIEAIECSNEIIVAYPDVYVIVRNVSNNSVVREYMPNGRGN